MSFLQAFRKNLENEVRKMVYYSKIAQNDLLAISGETIFKIDPLK